ncbi:RTA1 like protein-domain-containing protein [Mycena olivaceomarginata]|nr:RTA1 like protein-domain-containing protein [Mycena olivaceomarginata]
MVQVVCLDPHDENYNFLYCPSFPAAVIFSALFGLTTLAHIVQAGHYRKKFCWVIIMGGLWETGGSSCAAFAIPSQLIVILAPLWINAFLYVLMARFVYFFLPDRRVGGIGARRLSLLFVILDITAFLVQAGGGSLISSDSPKLALLGIHIYMGGIGLQQLFVLGFTALVIRFHHKMNRIGGSTAWKQPLYTMYASLILITIRIVFRLIEFSSGVFSPITMHEAPFYCLEALPMFVALLLWNVCHPGRVLVGPDSEFPKKEKKKSKKSKREKSDDGEAMDLRPLTTPQPL